MPSLTVWAEHDFDINALEKYCESTKQAIGILVDLWTSNATALSNMATIIEHSSNAKNDEEVLNNFLEDKIADRAAQSLFQYGKGGCPIETQHLKALRRCLAEHDQKLPNALQELLSASTRLSQVSAELTEARKGKSEADQALLSAVMSKSELEKRFTPSAVGTSQLPASAVNIMKKCDDRIKAAQANQLSCGERLTDLREQLDDITSQSAQSRKENLQIVENVEKKKLNAIATTSNEILNLELILSTSLGQETLGIIEHVEPPVNQSVMSVNSSMYSSQSIQGLDWVERILRLDPADRTLFALNQLAEEVATHESEDEIKISDLEREVEKIKAQINQLQDGKGSFADRLAADYSGGDQRLAPKHLGTELLVIAPRFSLPLPLKTDCYARHFWQGFAVEEKHSELSKLVDLPVVVAGGEDVLRRGVALSNHEWDIIAYEHVLLGYFEITTRYPHLLSSSQWNKLRSVIHMCRLKLKIPTKIHEAITELLLPDSIAIQDEITPLDVRFRLCRLMTVTDAARANPHYEQWMKRQIAYLDLSVRCMQKEDLSGFVESSIAPCLAVLVSSVVNQEDLDLEAASELLDLFSTFCEENLEVSQIPVPRGVLHQLISRVWKLCLVAITDEESGLSSDLPVVAAFLHNFLTARLYPYHVLWLTAWLWESVLQSSPSVPASVAKQVAEMLKPGDKWLDKLCGDLFWFGRSGVGASSIGSVSPGSKASSAASRLASAEGKGPTAAAAAPVTSPTASEHDARTRIVALDLAYVNILTCSARDSIVSSLCDYRSKLEPEALELCVDVFKNLMARTNAQVPIFLWPSEADFQQYLQLMCEYFISESARSVCNRLIEPQKFLDSVAVARAHANDEARGVWIEDVSAAFWKVIFEFNCEMEIYSLAWKKTTLTGKHKIIWSKGLQSRIRSVVEMINRDDDLWLADRVPPGGQELLAVLQVWERVSGDGGLTDIIRPKISRSLSLHLDRVERDSLPACMHNNHGEPGVAWAATRPPQIVHSTKCVDLWTTIFTAVQACIDSASAQLSMGTCAQMIVRCVERYCDNAREGFSGDISYAHPLLVKSKRCFNRLVRSVEDDSELPEIFKNKKKRKNRLFKKDAGNYASGAGASGGEESDSEVRRAGGSVSAEGLNLIGDNHFFLSDYLVITARLPSQDPTALMVRLHDMAFSMGELDKVRETLKESIEKEHVKLSRLFKSQAKFADDSTGNATTLLPQLPKESLQAMLDSVESGIADSIQILSSAAELVSAYLGINLVFTDMREELFERLYMPTTRDYPLSRILKRFENEKLTAFALMAPVKWRTDLVRSIVANFVVAWVYVVSDMASRGRIFKEFDSTVMNNDLTALHGLAEELGLQNDLETQEVLRSVGCLPVYISGSTPAEFKASCERALADPTEKSKTKSRLAKTAVPTVAAASSSKKATMLK